MKLDQKQLVPIVTLAALGIAIAYGGYSYVVSMFQSRYDQITTLTKSVSKAKGEANRVHKAQKSLREHENRSLPSNANVAGTAYHAWLVETLDDLGFGTPQITLTRSKESAGFMTTHAFTVNTENEMPKILAFLDRFHANDVMHRITKLTLKPVANSRKLHAVIGIEAVSLRGGKDSEQLEVVPSERYNSDSFAAVSDTILRRNLFDVPNRPPTIDVSSVVNASRGRPVDARLSGKDPDRFDLLNWELVDAGNTNAKIDPEKGTLTWTPDKNGDYTFVVKATDNSYPPLSSEKKFRIVVTDPPVPPTPEAPKGYDITKHAVLTAILKEGEQGEIWMLIRTSGELLRLREGDSFQVGTTKGTVEKISDRDCTLNIDGTSKRLELSAPLSDARPTGAL